MARGLSLTSEALRSDTSLEVLVEQPMHDGGFDIDEEYERRVKGLYGAIVEFITRADQALPRSLSEQLFALRQAARHIVEAVKDTKHLRKNLSRHALSANPDIRRQYNAIRIHLGSVLRRLDALRREEGGPAVALSLDSIRVDIETFSESLNGAIDEMIRSHRIAADLATSLMNDSGYAYHVARNLVAAGETALLAHDQHLGHAVRSVALDEAEIDDIAKARKS
jgi:phosphate:Na+ symporter